MVFADSKNKLEKSKLTEENKEKFSLETPLWIKFLTHKFKRLKKLSLLSILSSIFFLLYIFVELGYIFLVVGVDFYLRTYQFYFNILIILNYITCLLIILKISKDFQDKITENKKIFGKKYEKYLAFLNRLSKHKLWIIIPLTFAVVTSIYYIYSTGFSTNFEYITWSGETIYISGNTKFWFIFMKFWALTFYFIYFFIVGIAVVVGLIIAVGIIKIGSKKYSLIITYRELREGIFRKIGDFFLSIATGVIIISTLWSVLGLIHIFLFQMISAGLFYLLVALSFTVIDLIFLSSFIIRFHNIIREEKRRLQTELFDQIQLKISSKEYEKLNFIEKYYDRIENISEWPFNTFNTKEFLLAILLNIIPFILSYFIPV